VRPASHAHDGLPTDEADSVVLAVPKGAVVFYSPNLVHRGRANTLGVERVALTLNLMGSNGLVPSDIPLAVDPSDAGRWWLVGSDLVESARWGEAWGA